MIGDMVSDGFTTEQYFQYWKSVPPNASTFNTALETNNSGNGLNGSHFDTFVPSNASSFNTASGANTSFDAGESGFFVAAMMIWALTPLIYTIFLLIVFMSASQWSDKSFNITSTSDSNFFFHFIKYNPSLSQPFENHILVKSLVAILLSPLIFFFSLFACYIIFPFSSIVMSLRHLIEACRNIGKQNKLNSFPYNQQNISNTNSNNRSTFEKIRGIFLIPEDQLPLLKFMECFWEACFQCGFAMFYLYKVNNSDLEDKDVFSENLTVIVSMIMSIGSIFITFITFIITNLKLDYGTDYYKRYRPSKDIVPLVLLSVPIALTGMFIFLVVEI